MQVIFTVLNCRPFPNGEERLVADLDVVCWDAEQHMPYVYAALAFIMVIPIGVPGGLFGYLYTYRSDLFEDDPDQPGALRPTENPKGPATKHLSSMYRKYEPWTFYFEAVSRALNHWSSFSMRQTFSDSWPQCKHPAGAAMGLGGGGA